MDKAGSFFYFLNFYVYGLPVCMNMQHLYVWCSQRPEKVLDLHKLESQTYHMGTRSQTHSLQEQHVLLTGELSLQLLAFGSSFFNCLIFKKIKF